MMPQRTKAMRRIFSFLVVIACVTACSSLSDPEKALQSYARAVNERRCDDAFKHLSTRTRHAIDVLLAEPRHRWSAVPKEEYYCSQFTFEDCKWKETTVD